ncbi:hypothetical protein L3Y34_015297 [Caenorhabditis briggsae]|uniref:RING-type domain-containing protein n=1 Tax=Caenorhabditis briggsae TaxID=6238 RepID=A0AAE9DU98_CAEBR|nr:hypothetical protein L3Y34_015297 [Caenorhabditis briggsae]
MEDADLAEIPPASPDDDNADRASCMVCYNVFHSKLRVPKSLPCGHSFCQGCINSLISNTPQFVRGLPCPTCRKMVPYENPQNPQSSIPTNFVLREVLEKQETDNLSQLGEKYCCRHCQREFHEKDLMKCDTCCPKARNDDSVDFMGRPNLTLSCSGCMVRHHRGHLFVPQAIVQARWKHRSLYQKFAKSVEEEDKRVDKFIESMTNAIEIAQKFKTNLHETARQVENNPLHTKISSVLKNFVKAASDSAKFMNISTDCIERFTKPSAPQNSMLGKELFKFEKPANEVVQDYGQCLKNLFKESHQSTSQGRNVNNLDPAGPAPVANVAPAASAAAPVARAAPAVAAMPNLGGVLDIRNPFANLFGNQFLQNINIGQMHMPLNNFNQVFMQQRDQYLQLQALQAQQQAVQHHALQQLAQQAQAQNQFLWNMNVAVAQADQQQENFNVQFQLDVPPPDNRNRVQDFFNDQIIALNPAFVGNGAVTLERFIRTLVDNVRLDDGWQEVYNFFFVAPYEDRDFTPRGSLQICAVLQTILNAGILIQGRMPYTGFEQLLQDLQELDNVEEVVEEPEVVWIRDDDDVVFLNMQQAQMAPPAADDEQPEVLIVAPVIDNNAEQNMADEGEQVGQNEEIQEEVVGNEQEQPNVQVQRDDFEIQIRDNFVFQHEDLVPLPPARSTRGAKRRADSIAQQAQQNEQRNEPPATPEVRRRGRPKRNRPG